MAKLIDRIRAAKRAFYSPADDYWYQPASPPTSSGVHVTPLTAMRVTVVYACLRILADSIAQIPLHFYERTDESSSQKRRATTHPLYRLLHDRPNSEQTAFEFRKLMQAWLAARGNAYAWIEFNRNADPIGLWPLHPTTVEPKRRENESIVYRVRDAKGKTTEYPAWRILHLKGLCDDGLLGLGPIAQARESIGMALAAEQYGARFFGNDARPSIVFQVPGRMAAEDKKRYIDAWATEYGRGGQHRPAVLDQGMTLNPFGVAPEDAQFLETRQFQVEEIARLFGVPPHMVGAVDKATSWGTGIEQQSIGFVTFTLGPWMTCWEQGLSRALLKESERDKYFFEFMADSLVRGDMKSRYDAYWIGRQMGVWSANDIRDRENANRLPGEIGDIYWQPSNMTPAGTQPEPKPALPAPKAQPEDDGAATTGASAGAINGISGERGNGNGTHRNQ